MMGLSCNCDYEPLPGDTVWYEPADFETYKPARSVRCCSCGTAVRTGDECAAFRRYKVPESAVEQRIYGEDGEVPRATWFMCEECAGLFFSLRDLGFCVDIHDHMRTLVAEYAATYQQQGGATP